MPEFNDRIYCGKGKQGKYGVKLNICLDDIPAEHTTTGKNGKRYARLELKESRKPDDYGNTHYVEVDTWKPDGQRRESAPSGSKPAAPPDDELPFM